MSSESPSNPLSLSGLIPLFPVRVTRIPAFDEYPVPPLVIVIPVTTPEPLMVAVAVAPVPEPPEIVTVGAALYPDPPSCTAIPVIAPLATVTVPADALLELLALDHGAFIPKRN